MNILAIEPVVDNDETIPLDYLDRENLLAMDIPSHLADELLNRSQHRGHGGLPIIDVTQLDDLLSIEDDLTEGRYRRLIEGGAQ
jgi:hypothetical protein